MNYSVLAALIILLAIGLVWYYSWRWLLSKVKSKVLGFVMVVIIGISTVSLIIGAMMLLFFLAFTYYPEHDFDKNRWISEPDKRYEMTGSLITGELLMGKSKDEVAMLLGTERRLEWTKDGLDCWQYDIGDKPTFGMDLDPDAIDVYFKNGKVVRVYEHET